MRFRLSVSFVLFYGTNRGCDLIHPGSAVLGDGVSGIHMRSSRVAGIKPRAILPDRRWLDRRSCETSVSPLRLGLWSRC